MPDIILTTLNAKYIHASLGLRYLFANMGKLQDRTKIIEFDINQRSIDIAEVILNQSPKIIGIGVYVWNVALVTELVEIIKAINPNVCIILGGPEVSYFDDLPNVVEKADFVIAGEADTEFALLCERILLGQRPLTKLIKAEQPALDSLNLPYKYYTDSDLEHRVIYVESSRGCPFGCEFCLSAIDRNLRFFPLEKFLVELKGLINRGVRTIKFVDRTFNIQGSAALKVLQFLKENLDRPVFIHFEVIPDRLTIEQIELAASLPMATIQFEAGIQTLNEEVCARIGRNQNSEKALDNLKYIVNKTNILLHADLIAGLPGENLASFAESFNKLAEIWPHDIQVGILKRLRGSLIKRHSVDFSMVFNPGPPYQILKNNLMSFEDLQRIQRFARLWDLVGNHSRFRNATGLIFLNSTDKFGSFMDFTDWMHRKVGRFYGIALHRLAGLIMEYLTKEKSICSTVVADALWQDYKAIGHSSPPPFLKDFVG